MALAVCHQGHKLRFYNAADLVNDLIRAQDDSLLTRFLAKALKHDSLVIDELGFILFSPVGVELMFHFSSTLYERVAVAITTNLRFADWNQVFGSEQLTAALLDRLTQRSTILEFVGESYRSQERMQGEAREDRTH